MPKARAPHPSRPTRVAFNATKYGRDLLLDVAWVHAIPSFILDAPHALEFFDIIVVTRGRGTFYLDAHRHTVRAGTVLFTTPGQVRRWKVEGLDGICLFFTAGFVTEFLRDDAFIDRLPYFQSDPARASLQLAPGALRRVRSRLSAMNGELADLRRDSIELLRAGLHETLIVLAREYASAHHVAPRRATHPIVSRFLTLVERDVHRRHRVAEYARELGVSPGYLNVLCLTFTGTGAKDVIAAAIVARARRMLLYSTESVARIAASLGFDDPSYFGRFFRRRTGQTPASFRS